MFTEANTKTNLPAQVEINALTAVMKYASVPPHTSFVTQVVRLEDVDAITVRSKLTNPSVNCAIQSRTKGFTFVTNSE